MPSTRLCGRIGCGKPAVGALLVAAQECEAWLVGLDHSAAPEGAALCESHADRIRVPQGWKLHDERTPAKPTRRRKRKPKAEGQVVEASEGQVVEASEGGAVETSESGIVETEAAPSTPSGSETETGSETKSDVEGGEGEASDTGPSLQVLPGGDEPEDTTVFEDDGQGALWGEDRLDALAADDSTPLLKRAFRVVRDD